MAVAHSVIHALVLAGGHAPWRNTPKALLPINDRPLLTRTVEALTQVPQVATVQCYHDAIYKPAQLCYHSKHVTKHMTV